MYERKTNGNKQFAIWVSDHTLGPKLESCFSQAKTTILRLCLESIMHIVIIEKTLYQINKLTNIQ